MSLQRWKVIAKPANNVGLPWEFLTKLGVPTDEGGPMPRVAFKLRIKADAIEGYERDHQAVWPELLAKLKEVGISEYSIFRRGQELILVMQVIDFDAAWDALASDVVNLRWQQEMAKYFEPVPDLQPGERFAMMKEVFYMR